ncbi:hypothetical protein ACI2K4_24540 [Micromonospora sp. NPDC050397]|uniref:hypothetical protein n=1 Tax=Micromonospora sp. NPDC050397 TaxID=3364279 RepID=UPI00384C4EB0
MAADADDRPALTAPRPAAVAPAEPRPAGRTTPTQPILGLAGLTFVLPLFFLLAFLLGSAEASLVVLGPLATFALPVIAMIAFWWQDWPGSHLRAGWVGLTDTLIAGVAGVGLTILGQLVVSRVDLRGIFVADAGPGHVATFPVTLALGAGTFTAILQLTLVCERCPLARLPRVPAGLAALALSWVVAVLAYLLVVNLDHVPAAVRAADGLRNPGGPLAAPVYGALLVTLGVWQVLLFVALRGLPFSLIGRRWLRILAGNAGVAGATAATFPLVWRVAGWPPARISAVGGTVIAAALLVAMLFEGWPATRLRPYPGRTALVGLVALVAAALYGVLWAYAGQIDWVRATAEDWISTAALNFIALGVVMHVAVWQRWPVRSGATPGHAPGSATDAGARSRS